MRVSGMYNCNLCVRELTREFNEAHKGVIFIKATGHEAARIELVDFTDPDADVHICVTCLMKIEVALLKPAAFYAKTKQTGANDE